MRTFRRIFSEFDEDDFTYNESNVSIIEEEQDYNLVLVMFWKNDKCFHKGLLINVDNKIIYYDKLGAKIVDITLLEIHKGIWSKLIRYDDWSDNKANMITFKDIEELTKNELINAFYNVGQYLQD